MATWSYQSLAQFDVSGTTAANSGEFNSSFSLQDNEIGGVDGQTFEDGDFVDGGFSVNGNLLYVGTIEHGGETFVVVEDVNNPNTYYLYSSQPIQDPSQYPSSFDTDDIDTGPFTVCFAAGTLINTTEGARPVEALTTDDHVLTAAGDAVPVLWIGRQTVMTAFGPAERLLPIRIAAGALDEGVPLRDLTITADHALLVDGVLVHAGALVGLPGISRVPLSEMGDSYIVYHIETDAHEIVLAEGAPAETFIDNVSRRVFDNYAEFEALFGDVPEMQELDFPRAMSARQVPERIRVKLLARSLASTDAA